MSHQRPLIVVTGRHRPHELLLFALQVVLGLGYLLSVPAPQSLAALVPSWLVFLWAGGLVLSGIVGLAAAWRKQTLAALELERAALIVSAGALLLIGGASFVATGWRAIFGGSMILAWALANITRCLQIRHDAKQMAGG